MTKEEKKTVYINWLEPCCNCGNNDFYIETLAPKGSLNHLDSVICKCGQSGYIDIQDDSAFVCWEELTDGDIKYNKLKIMYDNAIECLMKSNYGDVKYLRNRGVIE